MWSRTQPPLPQLHALRVYRGLHQDQVPRTREASKGQVRRMLERLFGAMFPVYGGETEAQKARGTHLR